MKLPPHSSRIAGRRGIMLTEVLVYAAVFTLIGSLATGAFFRVWDASRRLQTNTDSIIRALQAGEQWRADVRHASAALRSFEDDNGQHLEIPQPSERIFYHVSTNGIHRRTGENGPWVPLLPRPAHSRMFLDHRQHVTAWRWELELTTGKQNPRTKPRFTFVAVPSTVELRP